MKLISFNWLIFILAAVIVFCSTYGWQIRRKATVTKLSLADQSLKDQLAQNLHKHVYTLSHVIGNRNLFSYAQLQKADHYITEQLQSYGYKVEFQKYQLSGKETENIIVTKIGSLATDKIMVIGAHYDSCFNPGADDNASSVAVLLELARLLIHAKTQHTIKLVFFVNEEPPFFKSENMGSRIFAKRAKADNENIVAMICLEMVGYYNEKAFSQRYPPLLGFFFPNRANFIAVVGNFASKWLVKKVTKNFKQQIALPVTSIATFGFIPGVDFSDHWSFWKEGYPAVMLTDTAFYRYSHYHSSTDTYEKLNYQNMEEIVIGLKYLTLGF